MAPEQIRGKPRPTSDQYALGVVVYEWLCGDRPFQGSFTEVATQHLLVPPPPLHEKLSTIPPSIEQVVMIALAKDPQERFSSVQAFATALEQANEPARFQTFAPSVSSLEPTIAVIPPTRHPWPAIPDASLSQPPEPAVISTPSIQVERTKLGSITWLARSQSLRTSPVSFSSSQTPTTTTDPTPKPTPHSLPPGTTLLTFHGHSSGVNAVAWSPDSKRIASGADNPMLVWNAADGNKIFTYRGHSNRVASLAWSPDGTRIASGSDDTTAQVWSASNGGNVLTYRSHTNVVQSVAWALNGQHIVSGSHDNSAQVWDAFTGNNVLTYRGHSAWVLSVAWSPDGTRIASGSSDTKVQVWQAS